MEMATVQNRSCGQSLGEQRWVLKSTANVSRVNTPTGGFSWQVENSNSKIKPKSTVKSCTLQSGHCSLDFMPSFKVWVCLTAIQCTELLSLDHQELCVVCNRVLSFTEVASCAFVTTVDLIHIVLLYSLLKHWIVWSWTVAPVWEIQG